MLKSPVKTFEGISLDTDPNFGTYSPFCGTIINISTNRNPYKRGMKHWLIKIHSDMYRLYFKTSFG